MGNCIVELGENAITITYNQFNNIVNNLRNQISVYVNPNDNVAICIPNGILFCSAFKAITSLCRISVTPLNPAYKEEEFEYYLKELNSRIVISTSAPTADLVKAANHLNIKLLTLGSSHSCDLKLNLKVSQSPYPICNPADLALILFTSGTTSKPKMVPITHYQLSLAVQTLTDHFQLHKDICYLIMPLFHVHGLIGCFLTTLESKGCLVIRPKFSASLFLGDILKFKCTWYSAVPTIHKILLSKPEYLNFANSGHSLRFVRSCSSSLSVATLKQLKNAFGVPVLESYGMTESTHVTSSNSSLFSKPGSVGKPYNGVSVSIRTLQDVLLGPNIVGQVCIKGENVISRYLSPKTATREAFTKSGWFLTGDEGYMDSEGFLFLVGRSKEFINRGGEKINPLEIDEGLLEHPLIAEAVTFGLEDSIRGQEVYAAVKLKSLLDESELKDWCIKRFADFKVPKRIFIVSEIPTTSTGKIQRRLVAAKFQSKI